MKERKKKKRTGYGATLLQDEKQTERETMDGRGETQNRREKKRGSLRRMNAIAEKIATALAGLEKKRRVKEEKNQKDNDEKRKEDEEEEKNKKEGKIGADDGRYHLASPLFEEDEEKMNK